MKANAVHWKPLKIHSPSDSCTIRAAGFVEQTEVVRVEWPPRKVPWAATVVWLMRFLPIVLLIVWVCSGRASCFIASPPAAVTSSRAWSRHCWCQNKHRRDHGNVLAGAIGDFDSRLLLGCRPSMGMGARKVRVLNGWLLVYCI